MLERFLGVVALAFVAGCVAAAPATTSSTPNIATSTTTPSPTALASAPTTTVVVLPAVEHRIGVRLVDGAGQFYDRLTGDRFVPRGVNLIRLSGGGHSTLDVGQYDPGRIEATFSDLATMGYNVVRVFLNSRPGGMPGSVGGLSPEYLDNVVDLLDKARTHGIQIVLTQDWLPESAAWGFESDPLIDNVNAMYLSRGGVETNQHFYREWVSALAARGAAFDALLAYELRNELYFTESYPPFSLTSGMMTTAKGKTYDLGETGAHRRLLEENLVSWVDTMRAEILAIDPTALVTVGFFQPKGPNTSREGDDRIIETEQVIQGSSLDFIDLHGYPGGELDLAQIVGNFGLPPVSREAARAWGVRSRARPSSDHRRCCSGPGRWQVDSCAHGFGGWLLWTWDTAEQPEFWTGVDEEQAIGRALSPGLRPDPCQPGELGLPEELARNAVVRASSGGSPSNVVDGLTDTVWSAGAGPIQWVELDLGASRTVESIHLLVAQDPPGPTAHVVSVRGESGDWRELATLSDTTSDGQWLDVVLSAPLEGVRFIGIETVESPSWVAWREISILGN